MSLELKRTVELLLKAIKRCSGGKETSRVIYETIGTFAERLPRTKLLLILFRIKIQWLATNTNYLLNWFMNYSDSAENLFNKEYLLR